MGSTSPNNSLTTVCPNIATLLAFFISDSNSIGLFNLKFSCTISFVIDLMLVIKSKASSMKTGKYFYR